MLSLLWIPWTEQVGLGFCTAGDVRLQRGERASGMPAQDWCPKKVTSSEDGGGPGVLG